MPKDCVLLQKNSDGHGDSAPHLLGAPGLTGGLTAYFGMISLEIRKRVKPSSFRAAAGSVGSLAGQFAKLRGTRVIGIAGATKSAATSSVSLVLTPASTIKPGCWHRSLSGSVRRAFPCFDNVGDRFWKRCWPVLGCARAWCSAADLAVQRRTKMDFAAQL